MIDELTFLEEGMYTRRDDVVRKIVEELKNSPRTTLGAISGYIKDNLKFEEAHKSDLFRKRTASQILDSGIVTGCTDVGLAFIVLAREFGIPTKYVETFEEKWLSDANPRRISGHIFVDVKLKDGWHAYEPINGFTVNNQYALSHGNYIEVGKGLDFSELYLKFGNMYTSGPINLQSLDDMRKLSRYMIIKK